MTALRKSLAELLALPARVDPADVSAAVAERRRLLTIAISQLSPEGVWELLKTGVGEVYLVQPAIEHLESDHTLFGLLTCLLRVRAYHWAERPDMVRRVRAIVGQALGDLSEWDGMSDAVVAAMRQRIPILEEWASFERALSKIPE